MNRKKKAGQREHQWREGRKRKGLCLLCPKKTDPNHVNCVACRKRLRESAHYRSVQDKSRIKRLYNLTPDERVGLAKFQRKRCAICRRKSNPKHWMDIDHDHETGLIRGLLCNRCNAGIGRLKTIALLQAALLYLSAPPALEFFGEPKYGRIRAK